MVAVGSDRFSSVYQHLSRIGFQRLKSRSYLSRSFRVPYDSSCCRRSYSNYYGVKLLRRNLQKHECRLRLSFVLFRAMDEDSLHFSFNDTGSDTDGSSYILSSSEGEESDGELLMNQVINDLDVPSINEKFDPYDDSLRMTSHRLAMLGKGHRKDRIKYGVLINMGLITFLAMLLLVLDSYAWRIVRLPLPPFYFTRPFLISAVLVSFAGYMCVPLLRGLNIRQIVRKEGTFRNFSRKRTPTMGGLFFIPIGVMVAMFIVGFSSVGVSGAAAVTLAFAAIGLIDDIVGLVKHQNYGLSPWIKVLLELKVFGLPHAMHVDNAFGVPFWKLLRPVFGKVAVSTWFSLWLDKTSIPSPYGMKYLVPLPACLGILCFGKCYLLLTSFCFVSLGNGIKLTDGLHGLVGGTASLAFMGMSIAVLPICPDLAVFGASMAGACVGFLIHNRYRASVLLGVIGSLALGGGLASMAACTGMFVPLFISSGIFVVEILFVILQVSYLKSTKLFRGSRHRLFKMAPFHHHLRLYGFKEPEIVAGLYAISSFLALLAGYVGLISA